MPLSILQNPFINRRRFAIATDISAIALCLAAASSSGLIPALPHSPTGLGIAIVFSGFALLGYCGTYRIDMLGSLRDLTPRVVAATAGGILLAGVACLIASASAETFARFTLLALLSGCGVAAARALLSVGYRLVPHRVLVVGTNSLGHAIVRGLKERQHAGIQVAGILTRDVLEVGDTFAGHQISGTVTELEKIIGDQSIDRVVVTGIQEDTIPTDVLLAAKTTQRIRVDSGFDFYEGLAERLPLSELDSSSIVFAEGFRPSYAYEVTSRIIDIAFAGFGLILASPLLAIAAAAIRYESPGSPFYSQERVGQRGNVFHVQKLRSMRAEAERDTGAVWNAGSGDDRVTRVGRFLRKTRIDELPQLWNVLVGDMRLVGPRPERPEFIHELEEAYPHFSLRHVIKPGLTGLAQIRQGYVNDLASWGPKLSFDLYYVKHRSLVLDLRILLETSRTVLLLKGV